jgi:hypothetical protein
MANRRTLDCTLYVYVVSVGFRRVLQRTPVEFKPLFTECATLPETENGSTFGSFLVIIYFSKIEDVIADVVGMGFWKRVSGRVRIGLLSLCPTMLPLRCHYSRVPFVFPFVDFSTFLVLACFVIHFISYENDRAQHGAPPTL